MLKSEGGLERYLSREKMSASAAGSSEPTLVSLAECILEQARLLEKSVPESPTFQKDTLADLPAHLEPARDSLIEGTEILNALCRGSAGTHGRIRQGNAYRVSGRKILGAISCELSTY